MVVGGESVCKLLPGAAPRKQKLDQKKMGTPATLHVQHTSLYISFDVLHDYNVKCFMKDMSYVFGFFLFSYFFTAAYSHLGGR